jgi:RecA-family ATPase
MNNYEHTDYSLEEFAQKFGESDMEVSDKLSVGVLWRDFQNKRFALTDRILFGLRRGNVGLPLAETNAGKTTLSLNLSLSLAAARAFPPFINQPHSALRVMYVDGESTPAELQADVACMAREFSQVERDRLNENLCIVCDQQITGESLNLANARHMQRVMEEAERFKPDLTIIDTMAALFNLEEENSNTEVKSVVMQPLKNLARYANGAVLLAHHVGKPRSEEGIISSHAYKGRGASNFGALARSVVTITTPDRTDPEHVIVALPKAKGYRMKPLVLRLNPHTRWFEVTDEIPAVEFTCLKRVMSVVSSKRTTGEIVNALRGKCSRRAVEDALSTAVQRNRLVRIGRGVYEPAISAESYSGRGSVELVDSVA